MTTDQTRTAFETAAVPIGIRAEDELPLLDPPDEALWAENYCCSAWDR